MCGFPPKTNIEEYEKYCNLTEQSFRKLHFILHTITYTEERSPRSTKWYCTQVKSIRNIFGTTLDLFLTNTCMITVEH